MTPLIVNKSHSFLIITSLILCRSDFIVGLHSENDKYVEKEHFIAAVYEHMEVPALPRCYDEGSSTLSN